jgi:uncharacterized RDD family membrane protein YckC
MRDESNKGNERVNLENEEEVTERGVTPVTENSDRLEEEGDQGLSAADIAAPAYRFAGFWMRSWAFLLDLIIVWSIGGIIIFPLFRMLGISANKSFMFSPAAIATTIILYGYFILMTKYFKQTLGKMVFGLQVIDLKNENLSWKTILFREGIGRYIGLVFAPFTYIVFLVVAFTRKKQGVHDIIADTTVVHEK